MTSSVHARAIVEGTAAAGRMCPFDYRYDPAVFRRPAEIEADVLYVVGGLYGNLAALDAIERLADAENATVVFNGDFHWFDAEPEWFAEIERRTARYPAIRGNIEAEIARANDIGAGCGCAYPENIDDGVVERSNEILSDLRKTAAGIPGARERLSRLPLHMTARVGPLSIGIVHGDASSLAGWRFAHDALDNPAIWRWLAGAHQAAGVDIFASTHTCVATLREFSFEKRLTVINNGAAGMPNFSGSRIGLITRIGTRPAPHSKVYGVVRDGVHIDAIDVVYDNEAFLKKFIARWPEGSPAHVSYFRRITNGLNYAVEKAAPLLHDVTMEATA